MSDNGLRKLLIITQFFPPSNAIASRRFGEMGPYFEQFGYKPSILTTNAEGPLLSPLDESQIVRVGRLAGGRIAPEHWSSDRILFRIAEKMGFRSLAISRGSADWFNAIRKVEDNIIHQIGPVDCIIGSYSPLTSFSVARKFSQILGVPWIADFRDLGAWKDDSRIWPVKWFDRVIEQSIVNSAQGFLTVSETLRSLLMHQYQKPTEVIYNGFDSRLEPSPEGNELTAGWDFRYPHFYYAGKLYPHQMASVELLLRTAISIPTLRIAFRILGPRYLERRVIKLASRLRLDNRVSILPPCEPQVVTKEANQSLANLVFENLYQTDLWSKGTITGKLLRLLPAKPPLLVIARPDSDIRDILNKTGRGNLCSTEADIYRFYTNLIDHPETLSGNTSAIHQFSKRAQTERLCIFLNRILGYQRLKNVECPRSRQDMREVLI